MWTLEPIGCDRVASPLTKEVELYNGQAALKYYKPQLDQVVEVKLTFQMPAIPLVLLLRPPSRILFALSPDDVDLVSPR